MASSMYHIGKDGELYVSDGYETRKVAAPATTEPPPWAPQVQALLDDLAEMERKARAEVCGITDLMRGVSPPADRALSDFTARRKAKREEAPVNSEYGVHETWEAFNAAREADYERALTLSRALSTPLPNDPPMSARLMPWRGKE